MMDLQSTLRASRNIVDWWRLLGWGDIFPLTLALSLRERGLEMASETIRGLPTCVSKLFRERGF
jgi:hypothetical protein